MNKTQIKVLMVEDNPDHAFLAQKCLEQISNYSVEIVSTAARCEQVVQEQNFDIILLDYNLQNEDGLTILNRFRKDEAMDVPVVVVTGHGHEKVAVEALKAGAFDYVVKNKDYPGFLPKVITRVLAKHKIYKEKKRAEAEIIVRNRELQVLNAVSEVVNQSLFLDKILNGVLTTLTLRLGLDASAIFLYDESKNEFQLKASEGFFEELRSLKGIDFNQTDFIQRVISNGHHNLIVDLTENAAEFSAQLSRNDLSSLTAVPLRYKDKTLGVLLLGSIQKDFFNSIHTDLLVSIGNQISIAVANANLYEQTEGLKNNLENVLNSSLDSMITIASNGTIKFFNDQFAKFFGVAPDEIAGEIFLKFIPEHLHGFFRQKIAELKSGKASIYEIEMFGAGGNCVSCLVSQSALRGRDDFLLVIKDISQVEQLQRQLMRSEKLSALGKMISGAAHELNNPLAGIYGYSQLLLEEELPTQVRSDIEVILRETKRCQKIVKNLLTFAKKHDSEREPIDTNEVINSVLELESYQLKVDGIEIEEELGESLPKITGDYHQLQQVLVHLINNANYALKESKTTPKKLAVHSKFVQDSVQIKISDNGVGISSENINKIFDPFFTTKEVGEGTGLGLSICFGIVESHQGKIFVDSTLGKGSTFTVELPLAQASPP